MMLWMDTTRAVSRHGLTLFYFYVTANKYMVNLYNIDMIVGKIAKKVLPVTLEVGSDYHVSDFI